MSARHVAGVVAMGALLAAPSPARAYDPWEIQVYDGTADSVGEASAELHLNHAFGRLPAEPPVLSPSGQSHATLELALGVTPWLEIGAYQQTTLLPDGRFQTAGNKARAKFVTPPSLFAHARFGLNVELSWLPQRYDADRFGLELRPIAAWEDDRLLVAVNPILGASLAGAGARLGPELAPAFEALVKIAGVVSVGVEYYGEIGPIAHPLAANAAQHYLFLAGNLIAFRHFELNVGAGPGMTPASEDFVAKAILGVSFGGLRAPP